MSRIKELEKEKIVEEIVKSYRKRHKIGHYVNSDTNFCIYDDGYWDIEEILYEVFLKAQLSGIHQGLALAETIVEEKFTEEHLLIDNIITTGKNLAGKPADLEFMKNYETELYELENELLKKLEEAKKND